MQRAQKTGLIRPAKLMAYSSGGVNFLFGDHERAQKTSQAPLEEKSSRWKSRT
jgi:hypothetical protein